MAKLSRFRSAALVLWILAASSAHSEIRLDKLNDCGDIERVYLSLKAHPLVSPAECRAPRDRLELALAARAGSNASPLCFLRTSPATFLNSFSCVRFNSRSATGAADVTCFRAAALSDIRTYQEFYAERFARSEANYLAAAQKCSVSAGDSANAAPSNFPPIASMLARFELGFVTSLGSGRPSDSLVFHGYAETDPEIGAGAPDAIEVVQMIVNSPVKLSVPSIVKKVGNWTIEVEDLATAESDINRQFAQSGAPIRFSFNIYNIVREGPHTMSRSAKEALMSSLHDSVTTELETEGFAELSEAEMKQQTGKSADDLLRQITSGLPFGHDPRIRLTGTFRILVKETGLPCARGERGAVAAYLMGTQPIEGVQRDFGSILFMVGRLGACSVSSDARAFAKNLSDHAIEEIGDALNHR
jgi:hypothetical protein